MITGPERRSQGTFWKEPCEQEKKKQPRIRSSLRRFVYDVDRSDAGVTGLAGLPMMIEGFHALGLAEACKREVKLKQRARGPSESEWIEMLTMLQLAGGESLEDINVLKQDDGLRRVWSILRQMSPRSGLGFLMRFHDPSQPESVQGRAVIHRETEGLMALGRVNAHLVATVQMLHPVETATLDYDASIHESTKSAALWTYEKIKGYQPSICLWVEQGLIVDDQFRDGNVPAGMGTLDLASRGVEAVPGAVKQIYARADSAFYEHKTLRYWDRKGVGFAVSADMTPDLRAAIERHPKEQWKVLVDREDLGEDEEEKRKDKEAEGVRKWAEIDFVPDDRAARKGERPFRYVAIELPPLSRQLDLFEPPEPKYVAIVTNRDELSGDALIHWHREKCGTVEHSHDAIKHDVGVRLFPSKYFGANAAWYRLGILALNLHQAMTLVALPHSCRKNRVPTTRFHLLNRGGRVVRKAGRYVLRLSRLAADVATVLLGVRLALAHLPSA